MGGELAEAPTTVACGPGNIRHGGCAQSRAGKDGTAELLLLLLHARQDGSASSGSLLLLSHLVVCVAVPW